MAFVLNDRVLESSTTTGTGPFTLAGAASTFQTFANGIGASNTTYYTIVNTNANEWEVGFGTLDATGLILTRTTVYRSSNSNNAVTFTAGTKNVFCTYPSIKSVNLNDTDDIQLDFSNATLLSRTAFQSSTTNGSTGIYALPNGSSTAASWQATNAADPTNASKILIATNGTTDVQLVSGINGTGTGSGVGGVLSVTITNGGSGYASGGTATYTSVALTGGAGANVIASTIVVTSGVVTAVTFPATGSGYAYVVGNTLTTANTNLGGSGSGLSLTVASIAGYLPLSFYNNNAQQMQLATSGNFAIGTGVAPSATSKLLVNGVIESNSGGFKFPNGSTQLTSATPSSATVGIGYTNTYAQPVKSYSATFTDAVVTTDNYISINPSPKTTSALIAVGSITAGSGYVSGTYTNVPLTGGSGTGAIASSITVTVGAVTSITLPANGTGSNYAYGDTLSASNANLGGSGSGFSVPVALITGGGDELEMDGIKVSAQCLTNGTITVYVDASPGYIAGGRTFAYTLG
jgi:hypothetical protein